MTLHQKSMLFAAIRSNDIETLESILSMEHSTRLLSAFGFGFHMLRKSIEYNRTEITQLLLDRGCPVELSSFKGDSPLHLIIAKKRNCYALVNRFLDRGAKVEQRNQWNETVLHAAFDANADDRVVQLLLKAHLKNSVLNEMNNLGLSYLHIACATADLDCVRQFVELGGADVNLQVKIECQSQYAGSTPLHMAVEFGKSEVIEYLLVQGANVYIPDSAGSTSIHLALELGETDIIEMLFQYDDDRLNCVNNYGLSHFMAACACGEPEIARNFLIDKFNGIQFLNVNEEVVGGDNETEYMLKGFTPLHFAAIFGRLEIVHELLADNAYCCALTEYEMTPAQLARMNEFHDVADVIIAHCQGYDRFL